MCLRQMRPILHRCQLALLELLVSKVKIRIKDVSAIYNNCIKYAGHWARQQPNDNKTHQSLMQFIKATNKAQLSSVTMQHLIKISATVIIMIISSTLTCRNNQRFLILQLLKQVLCPTTSRAHLDIVPDVGIMQCSQFQQNLQFKS